MYLKRLYIRNFRSIKDLDLEFTDGKNVIVGRNNSGKSNIVAALDAVLNASSPTYKRTQNITGKDFHSPERSGPRWQMPFSDSQYIADQRYCHCRLPT